MDLSIIIASYNARDHLQDCVLSLVVNPPRVLHEIIVVDNDSSDGSPEMIASRFPDIKLLKSETNMGFSKANNLAYRYSRGDHLLFLNSDTLVLRNALDNMITFQKSHPWAGIVGPKILNPGASPTRSYMRFLTAKTLFLGSRLLGKWFNVNRHRLHYTRYDYHSVRRVPWVSGACMMVRRDVFKKAGLFDEHYFLYLEDMDLCLTAFRRGFATVYLPTAAIVHSFGGSTYWDRQRLQRIRNRSMVHYFKKHHSRLALLSALFYILLFGGLR
jgi:GT2 family glycosyltransferase